LPRTLAAISEPDGGLTLVLSPSGLFGVDLAVTIYHVEQLDVQGNLSFERLIGVGRVSNVQQDGLVQVLVARPRRGYEDLWQRLRNKEAAMARQIVVKPSLSFSDAGLGVRDNE
jgi:hypothetical protein